MIVFKKDVVEMVQNADGVFEQADPDFVVSFDFNKPLNTAGVSEIHFVNTPSPSFAIGGRITGRPVRPEERPPLQKVDMTIHQEFIEALMKDFGKV